MSRNRDQINQVFTAPQTPVPARTKSLVWGDLLGFTSCLLHQDGSQHPSPWRGLRTPALTRP